MLHDLLFAARLLRKRPLTSLLTIASLALGIGAVTAVFSIVNAVLFRPYGPFNSDRWVYLWEHRIGSASLNQISVSMPNFRDWQRESGSIFSDVVVWLPWTYAASGDGIAEPESVSAAVITPDIFRAAGVAPAAGRWLNDQDAASGDRRVVLSYGFWRRAYGGDPALPGKTITLNGATHTVVGIAPPGFAFPPEQPTDIWTGMPAAALTAADRSMRTYRVAARLAPGVTVSAAKNALDLIGARLAADHPEDRGYGILAEPVREAVAGDFRAPLIALSGALGFALLLLCINIAYLRRVHLEARKRELALRMALGARRAQLLRQLLIETLLLFAIAGALGTLLSPLAVRLLLSMVPSDQIPWLHVSLSWPVLLGSIAITLAAALIAGLLPVSGVFRYALARQFSTGGTIAGSASPRRRLRALVVASQVALALIPLYGAGLLLRSFALLVAVPPGFAAQHRLTLSFLAPRGRYPGPNEISSLAQRLRDQVLHAPGVAQAGLAQSIPFSPGPRWLQAVTRTDPRRMTSFSQLPFVRYSVVTSGYSESLGIALRSGRFIGDQDTRGGLPVVVINQALARQQFPGEDPIGKQIWIGHAEALPTSQPRTIVGVVADMHMYALDTAPDPAAWVPIVQQDFGAEIWRNLYLVADCGLSPSAALPGIRERMHSVDTDLALTDITPMDDRVQESLWRQRFSSSVIAALGLAALAIAVLGVYGVTTYLSTLRSHEFGIRMAVGARPADIARLVLGECSIQIALGIAAGLAGAFALARVLQGLLYSVTPADPLTFAAVTVLLAGVALSACLLPARRAARIDPVTTLHHD